LVLGEDISLHKEQGMKTKEKRERRFKLIADARALLDTAEAANRDLTTEERTQYDAMLAESETLRSQVEREERQVELERDMLEARGRERGAPPESRGGNGGGNGGTPDEATVNALPEELREHFRRSARVTPEYRRAFRSYLRNGAISPVLEHGEHNPEYRDLDASVATGAGFLRAPIQMVQTLIKKVDDLVFIRGLATKYQVPQAASLGVPTLTADPDEGDWTAELATGSADSGMAFGRRELHPFPLAKRIKLSNLLLRSAVIDVEGLVLDRLAYKRAITQEKAFLTGDGVKQPLGLFTASTDGISTGRDVVAGSTTAITFDGLNDAKYNMKAQYWAKLLWLFHRTALGQISKIKDGEGQYMWQPSRQAGQPDMLLATPFKMSEYVPNTFTTGKYVGMIGDFSWYWIADSLDLQIQRLVELYAETNQTGFITRQETDGMPVLEEAFTRLKLA
jgi:HK97 family phage major capsid protein